MNTVEKVKAICKERKIPISRLEKACGFANGYIGQLKKGTVPDDRLIRIASFLEVPVETLIASPETVKNVIDYEVSMNNNLRMIVEGARNLHANEQEYVINLIKLLNSKHTKTPHGT